MKSIFGESAAPRNNLMPRQGNDPLVALVESAMKKAEQKKQDDKEKK